MTNYERIKNMSVEEMAKYFADTKGLCFSCEIFKFCQKGFGDCEQTHLDWLNKEVEE